MGRTIQAESKTLEYPTVLSLEFDPEVIEYYDQPPTLYLQYKTGNGRNHSGRQTLDYFVITKSYAYYVECKRKSELIKISRSRPDHISYDETNDRFYSPAMDRYFDGTGIGYQFITEDDINKIESENLDLLNGYQYGKLSKLAASLLKKTLHEEGFIHIDTLISTGISVEDVYRAILSKICFFPLKTHSLLNNDDRLIYKSEEHFIHTYPKSDNSGFNCDDSLNLLNVDSKIIAATSMEIERASKEYQLLMSIQGSADIDRVASELELSKRTVYRKLNKIKKSDRSPVASLIANKADMGNRTPRLNPKVKSIIETVTEREYLSRKAVVKYEVYKLVKLECEASELPSPSPATIYKYLNDLSAVTSAYSRVSAKKSYQIDIYQRGLDGNYPFSRATRFLQHCHIDHTQTDVFTLTDYLTKARKPWLTAIKDSYTGLFLGYYLSFRNPSYISVMMCLRNMVRRWQLVPESIYVDGGKELNSRSIERLCAAYSITKASREGQPRAGTTIERAFGTLNTSFFHNLEGNSKATRNVRQITNKDLPANEAVWRLGDIDRIIDQVFQEYNRSHTEKGELSPLDLCEQSKEQYGLKPSCKIAFDDEFYFNSLPVVTKGYVTLRKGKPIRYEKMDFWNRKFHQVTTKGERCDARWDPEDYKSIYVYFCNKWIKAKTTDKVNANKEKRFITEELAIENTAKAKLNRQNSSKLTKAIIKEKGAIENERRLEEAHNEIPSLQPKRDYRTAREEKGSEKRSESISEEFVDPWSLDVPGFIDRRN
ncbi:MAG: Mu transposase C-terminal domain-containing protein [Balneolaceae bacterium]